MFLARGFADGNAGFVLARRFADGNVGFVLARGFGCPRRLNEIKLRFIRRDLDGRAKFSKANL